MIRVTCRCRESGVFGVTTMAFLAIIGSSSPYPIITLPVTEDGCDNHARPKVEQSYVVLGEARMFLCGSSSDISHTVTPVSIYPGLHMCQTPG